MEQERPEQILIRRIERQAPFPFWIEQFLVALGRFHWLDMLRVETEGQNEMIMGGPKSFLVHEIFGNSFAAGREIGLDESRLRQRVRFSGGDVDDVGLGVPGARFGGELIENPGCVGPIVFWFDERIALLKFFEQRLELVDGGKTVDHDPAFFFGALAELLLTILALQPLEELEWRSRALGQTERWKCQRDHRNNENTRSYRFAAHITPIVGSMP